MRCCGGISFPSAVEAGRWEAENIEHRTLNIEHRSEERKCGAVGCLFFLRRSTFDVRSHGCGCRLPEEGAEETEEATGNEDNDDDREIPWLFPWQPGGEVEAESHEKDIDGADEIPDVEDFEGMRHLGIGYGFPCGGEGAELVPYDGIDGDAGDREHGGDAGEEEDPGLGLGHEVAFVR
jgi:hypothetical protein